MAFEIERKFLVRGDVWRTLASQRSKIRQGYLSTSDKASIRVRIRDDKNATLTIKSQRSALRRMEFEYPVPLLEAEAMISLRQGSAIEKIRHVVPWGDLQWEIDVFLGSNAGLVIAEIELRNEQQDISLPDWIGTEVTGQTDYYNSALVMRPYCMWPHDFEVDALRA